MGVPIPAQVTLRIPLEPGQAEQVVVVTFDENRVSAADVKRWMLLHENGFYSTPVIGYYTDCKTSYIPKLEGDIKKTQQIVDDLNSSEYPPELSDVVAYLKNTQSLWLWQAEQGLAFLRSGQPPGAEYNGMDLGSCQEHFAQNRSQACHQVFVKWHTCVINTMQKQLGSYPKHRWKAFLDAYGMQERLESTIRD
jgi:hypothetical protein